MIVRARCDYPWTLAIALCAVAATICAQASPALRDLLVADSRIAGGELWRLVTGPLVHATWGHLVRDVALVAIAGTAYEAPLRARRALLFGGGLVLPGAAVLLAGDAAWYCGLSGLSHALLAAALVHELMQRRGPARMVVLALCAIAAAKPIYELVTGAPAFPMALGAGVRQVPLAHAVGVVIGIRTGFPSAACSTSRYSCSWRVAAPRSRDREAPRASGSVRAAAPCRR